MKKEIELFKNMPFFAKQIIRLIASVYDMKPTDILIKTNKRSITEPRFICIERIYFYGCSIHEKDNFPTRIIEDLFCIDRTALYHSKKVINNLCDTDDVFKASYEKICEILTTINMTPKENKPKEKTEISETEKPFQEDIEREEKSMNDYFTSQHENLISEDCKNEF